MRRVILCLLVLLCGSRSTAQHTFSIVAVDTITGEVGSAGATCLDEIREGLAAVVISDVIPGVGAIHTQALLDNANKRNARRLLSQGQHPNDIMNWLISNDARGIPNVRQYGVAMLDRNGQAEAAAFTGRDAFNFKGHIVGDTYAIQGNILLNNAILENMETGFQQTQGSLSEKLMGAMEAVQVAGADSRCFSEGVSSRSAFLRVARPDDPEFALSLDLQVNSTPFRVEPIAVLRDQFEAYQLVGTNNLNAAAIKIFPNPTDNIINIELPYTSSWVIEVFELDGKLLYSANLNVKEHRIEELPPRANILLLRVTENKKSGLSITKKILRGVE